MKSPHRPAATFALAFWTIALSVTTTARSADDTSSAIPAPPLIPSIPGLENPLPAPKISKDQEVELERRRQQLSKLEDNQWPRWKALIKQFRSLQKRRALAMAGSEAVRNKHIAALRTLFREAKAMCEEIVQLGVPGSDEWLVTFNTELANFGIEDPQTWRWNNNDDAQVKPQALVDPMTRVTYQLKADGQHVVAISSKGKVLWAHNVLDDSGIPPYRFSKPVITAFQLSADSPDDYEKHLPFSYWEGNYYSWRVIEVWFNSSQFGYIDAVSGKFHFLGQN